jgi:uncharacterized protein (DUF1778 family)
MSKIKSLRVSARVSTSDKKKIASLAKKAKQSIADFIRTKALATEQGSVRTYRKG